MLHRGFFHSTGAFRAGPPIAEFQELIGRFAVATDLGTLGELTTDIDRFVYDQALSVFLCAPQALYAVNNHVSFGPYKTTFEIAEVTVDEGHWSRQPDGSQPTSAVTVPTAVTNREKPGFAGAAGNAC